MRITIITPVLNRVATIEECLDSVQRQTHDDVEHIVIDGESSDGTLQAIQTRDPGVAQLITEADGGLYEGINKGLRCATGEVIGILGADDAYTGDWVLEEVARTFEDQDCDACYGDLIYVHPTQPERVLRSWVSGSYSPGSFQLGWMPAHPTFFVRKEVYDRLGNYDESFRISADYELMLRFVVGGKIRMSYVPRVMVRMRWGGISNNNLRNVARKSLEDWRAWRRNRLRGGRLAVLLKNIRKLPQFVTALAPRQTLQGT